jgi:hypothetical protein
MKVIQFQNPTADEYNLIKDTFGVEFNEYQFLQNHEMTESKTLYFLKDVPICKFNMIGVGHASDLRNPDCKFVNVDFSDFVAIANKQKTQSISWN